jgi:acetyl esterase/lipase
MAARGRLIYNPAREPTISPTLWLADKFFRFRFKRMFRKDPDVLQLRPMLKRMAKSMPVPRRITVTPIELGGVAGEELAGVSPDRTRAVLYLHGGGFVGGEPKTHRMIAWRLADGLGVPVFVIDYRLAPEHPHPAAVNDCTAAYRALAEKLGAGNVAVMGDSAGGNLTLTVGLQAKALGLPRPALLVCLSPATDLWAEGGSRVSNAESDACFDGGMFATLRARYCPEGSAEDPLLNPVRGDLAGLPPTLFQCSELEMLRDDSTRMADAMKAAGVQVTLEIWPDVFHVWQLAADVIPEAKAAVAKILAFVEAAWPLRLKG